MLNPEQRAAVEHEGGPLIVLAGPGTGKTRVLIQRAAHLIGERGVRPESVLALTFTNKAAGELQRRLAESLGSSTLAERVTASTFHSFGLRLIRRLADVAGLWAEPRIIDEGQQKSLLRAIATESGAGVAEFPYNPAAIVEPAARFVSQAHDRGLFGDEAVGYAEAWRARLGEVGESDAERAEAERCRRFSALAGMYREFESRCRARGWVTFGDLLLIPLRVLRENAAVRAMVREEYRHILVDEFQDTNLVQLELLKQVARRDHDLCVVGDDDQAIYAFRGSNQRSFAQFAEHWAPVTQVTLTRNYRCSEVVLRSAAEIINHCDDRFAPDKTTIVGTEAQRGGEPIAMVLYPGTVGAGPSVAEMIRRAVANGAKWGDFGVLTRRGAMLAEIAAALEAGGIPVDVPEAREEFRDPGVRDLMAWLRLLHDPFDNGSAVRVLTRPPFNVPILQVTQMMRTHAVSSAQEEAEQPEAKETPAVRSFVESLEGRREEAFVRFAGVFAKLREIAATEPVDRVVVETVTRAGLAGAEALGPAEHEARLTALARVLRFVRERQPNLDPPGRVGEFLRYFDDLEERDRAEGRSAEARMDDGVELSKVDAVRVLTAHASKGLEFDTVLLLPVSKGGDDFPMTRQREDEGEMPADLAVGGETTRMNEERRLFFVAMTRAQRRLVLMSASTQSSGRRRNPSIFWEEVMGAGPAVPTIAGELTVDDVALSRTEAVVFSGAGAGLGAGAAREMTAVRHDLAEALHVMTQTGADSKGYAELQERVAALGAAMTALSAATEAEARARLEAFPLSPAVRALAEERLERAAGAALAITPTTLRPGAPLRLSFSDIRMYLDCPRCYWLRRVVGVPERFVEGVNFGSIVHRSLEFFYKRLRDVEAGVLEGPPPDLEALLAIGRRAYEELRRPEEPFARQMVERIELALRRYHAEMHSPELNPVEVELAITFDYEHKGVAHQMAARIDRVDFDGRYHVIDYKTGADRKKYLEPPKDDLQMGIYYLALQQYLEEEEPAGTAQYWLVSSCSRGAVDFADLKLETIRRHIGKAIDGILAGQWRLEKPCRRCELIGDTAELAAETGVGADEDEG